MFFKIHGSALIQAANTLIAHSGSLGLPNVSFLCVGVGGGVLISFQLLYALKSLASRLKSGGHSSKSVEIFLSCTCFSKLK